MSVVLLHTSSVFTSTDYILIFHTHKHNTGTWPGGVLLNSPCSVVHHLCIAPSPVVHPLSVLILPVTMYNPLSLARLLGVVEVKV